MGKPGKTHRLKWEGQRYFCSCGKWACAGVWHKLRPPSPLWRELKLAAIRMAHDIHRREEHHKATTRARA